MKQLVATMVLLCAPHLLHAQLNGTKTIGGANPDYPTITAAVTALMNQGASGNVTFNIRPGTYTGQYDLGAISGTPGFITFKSENNDPASVVLAYDASSSADNFIFRLDGTDGVILQALTFAPTDTWFARSIYFFNACEVIQLLDCVFEGSTEPGQNSGFERNIVHCDQNDIGTADNPQDVMITDCLFHNGYAALDLNFEGNGGARSQGLIITGNRFEDQFATGVTVMNAVGQIGDNVVRTSQGNYFTGIRTGYFDGGSQIRRNRIEAYATTGGCTGIEVGNTQFTTGNLISNNMVYCNAPGDVWGMAVYNLWDMKIVHNSVLVAAGNQSQSHAFFHLSNFPDGQDALVRNNIFANNAGGAAYTVNVAANVATEDHNCLFTTGGIISNVGGNSYTTLAVHQSGTGQGAGDSDADPVFPIQPDLHLNGCTSDLAGQYFFVVAADLDGDARGNPTCDMGADEFTFSNTLNAGTVDLTIDDLPYTLSAPDGTGYAWNQGATSQSIEVVSEGIYFCEFTDVNGCTYTITWAVNVDFSTGLGEDVDPGVRVFPVPAMNELQVSGWRPGTVYEVLDVQGRLVMGGTAGSITVLDVSSLRTGVHHLRWGESGSWRSTRFIKQ